MAKVIIFGTNDLALLAQFYFKNDSDHEVVGFTVDREFLDQTQVEGLPCVAFEDLKSSFSPLEHSLFIPMTQKKMGQIRKKKYDLGKQMGYRFISYISSKATVWQPELIGENCFIFEDNTIQPFVRIGDNVVMWSGNHIGHHSQIGSHVFVTSHVVISGHVTIEPYTFLGVNSAVRDGITIAEGTLVGMGAVINKNTEAYGVYTTASAQKKSIRSDELPNF